MLHLLRKNSVKLSLVLVALCCVGVPVFAQTSAGPGSLHPRAVPLVTNDPYFSIWSFANHLTDGATRHWTGAPQSLTSLIRIDGTTYRLMGEQPQDLSALPQVGLEVLPTRTIYNFEGAGVHVGLTFMTPLLADDLEVLSRPVTYLTWEVRASDNKTHAVSLYYDNTAELVVNTGDEAVSWTRQKSPSSDLLVLRMGSQEQPILATAGDDLRINWGFLYAATPADQTTQSVPTTQSVLTEADLSRGQFASSGSLPAADSSRMPRAANDGWPVMAYRFDLGRVAATAKQRYVILAYDDLYSIEYFGRRLRPYWRRNGAEASDLLASAAHDYPALVAKCQKFDDELMADMTRVGGEQYARIAALAYRQSLAAQKLVADEKGQPLFFPKENFSNGCIGTVDVIYPAAPILLLLNTKLLRASVAPVLDYARSDRWHFSFAPHDLGKYPLANGQVYGGKEQSEKNQMPVEESGNVLLLVAAMAKIDGNAQFAQEYWPELTKWAEYLKRAGLDPENQLCTDDFAGHLAHNANLSLKAIEALGAYAMLADMLGKHADADSYHHLAQEFARQWVKMADDGEHYRLAFDNPGTWSQKYNLVWDRILGMDLFPPEVARKEIAFYKNKNNRYGLPLDNRKAYTKLDWEIWTATLAESREDWNAFVAPIFLWVNESPSRVPLTDWYWTTYGKQAGFQARSVVGGVFIKMLSDPAAWKKWSNWGR